jgi:hypothetical protein
MAYHAVTAPEVGEKSEHRPEPALLVGSGRLRVLTERDLIHAVQSGFAPDTPVGDLAHPSEGLGMIDEATSILEAARLMLNTEVSRLDSTESGEDEEASLSLRSPVRR